MPPKKRLSQWAENTNAKRTVRRIEVGWMDFDEEKGGFKQVKSVSGGGTRHLSVDKNETVSNIKLMAANLFSPMVSQTPPKVFHTIQLILRAHRCMWMLPVQLMSCISKVRSKFCDFICVPERKHNSSPKT